MLGCDNGYYAGGGGSTPPVADPRGLYTKVLYVGKHNGEAPIKGDITRPYKDISTAISNLSNTTEVIVVIGDRDTNQLFELDPADFVNLPTDTGYYTLNLHAINKPIIRGMINKEAIPNNGLNLNITGDSTLLTSMDLKECRVNIECDYLENIDKNTFVRLNSYANIDITVKYDVNVGSNEGYNLMLITGYNVTFKNIPLAWYLIEN